MQCEGANKDKSQILIWISENKFEQIIYNKSYMLAGQNGFMPIGSTMIEAKDNLRILGRDDILSELL
ncbi:hypothetical protein SPFL3102_02705 [Sporomusaceae bacterium FL31]|nr:hypothetical protein SPFL3101_02680 [Sporomusaceae bacterium FL31]GCE34877.1 hypothetical protein SPFL3102_02705 [Sporomusaceae bacterium]